MRPYPSAIIEGIIQPEPGDFVCGARGAVVCESACEYRPRRPEESVLYGVVAGHLETFLARQRERGWVVPQFVERELRDSL